MKTRTITAIFIAAIYVGTILLSVYVNEIFFDIFVLMLAVGAGLEMCHALDKKFSPSVDIFVVLYAFFGYIAFYLLGTFVGRGLEIAGYFLALVVFAGICALYCALSKRKTMRNAVTTISAMIYPVTILTYMLGINYMGSIRVSGILLVFLISCLTDTMAYFVGSLLHGPKLCPKISPKKTVSGAIGGLIGGMGGAMIVFALARYGVLHCAPLVSGTGWNVFHFLCIGFLGSVLNQIGDLIASFVKRKCEIKDYGSILPGHGGVLDRVDGMMFVGVVVYIYFGFLGV